MKPALSSLVAEMPARTRRFEHFAAASAKHNREAEAKKQNQVLPAVVVPKPPVSFYEAAYYWLMSRS